MKEKEFLPLLREKLGIDTLNPMQRRMLDTSSEQRDIMLLSPTGSGKTVAFIMPVLKRLRPASGRTQVVVVAPSRELVMQIAGVFNALASGYKVTALYGGHKVEDEVNALRIAPDIIVATPGRLLDHSRRGNADLMSVRILVVDEFDKTLELGFEDELGKIVKRLKNVSRIILTSATRADVLPEFLKLDNPLELDFSADAHTVRSRMRVHRVESDARDKLASLLVLLRNISGQDSPERCIVFVNHRESAERVAGWLREKGVDCVMYHGALEQRERESAVEMFDNGSRPVLVATDLAARGLDIEGVRHIIHYHQPLTADAYTHRNGRTARVDEEGDIYVLVGPDESLRDYVSVDDDWHLDATAQGALRSGMDTLYVSAGKKEKLSKGDILGFLGKVCGLPGQRIGRIKVFDHYSLVSVPADAVAEVIERSRTSKIKGTRRKITLLE